MSSALTNFIHFQSENNEKNSVHSSNDDAKESTASVPFDESYISSGSFADEQIRLEKKIEKIRKKITKNSLEREADVERFLNVVNKDGETAQMARLKQNFERKNKKYSQEAELLQVTLIFSSYFNNFRFNVLEETRRMRTTSTRFGEWSRLFKTRSRTQSIASKRRSRNYQNRRKFKRNGRNRYKHST